MKVELRHFIEFIGVMKPNSPKLLAAVARIARVYSHALDFARPKDTLSLRLAPGGSISAKIQLIKDIHEATGLGLKDSKDAADTIAAGGTFEFKFLTPDQYQGLVDMTRSLNWSPVLQLVG